MASAASPSLSLFRASRRHGYPPPGNNRRVLASDTSRDSPPPRRTKGTPGVDTRIHWSSPDEGWIGGRSRPDTATEKNQNLGGRFADLIGASTTSHYQLSTPPLPFARQCTSGSPLLRTSPLLTRVFKKKKKTTAAYRFLGVPADADMEEIKAAYRRLSKEYHPDTTVLPLKTASQKFMQLRQAYNVLSDEESRRFYDWTLAQEAESRRAERMRMRLDDPYMQDISNWESIPDTVDRLGGKNMELSDQAMTALTIDVVIILFSICCIIFVVFFKEPY